MSILSETKIDDCFEFSLVAFHEKLVFNFLHEISYLISINCNCNVWFMYYYSEMNRMGERKDWYIERGLKKWVGNFVWLCLLIVLVIVYPIQNHENMLNLGWKGLTLEIIIGRIWKTESKPKLHSIVTVNIELSYLRYCKIHMCWKLLKSVTKTKEQLRVLKKKFFLSVLEKLQFHERFI
jgi:hypothetical protein